MSDLSFDERLKQYRSMPGMSAWDRIADDWWNGKFSEDEARAFVDILFPPVTETSGRVKDRVKEEREQLEGVPFD